MTQRRLRLKPRRDEGTAAPLYVVCQIRQSNLSNATRVVRRVARSLSLSLSLQLNRRYLEERPLLGN